MIRKTQTRMALWLSVALVVGGFGCGSGSKYRLVPVSGTVTYEGEPLEAGQISFTVTGSKPLRAYGGVVKNGSFSVKAEPGDVIVQVMAMRDAPGKFIEAADGTKQPEQENYIPAKYNSKSKLKYTVPDSGAKDADFELVP